MITRREMLRGTLALGGAALFAPHLFSAVTIPENRRYTEQLGWSIGPQIYSFNRFPFDEALKMVAACGTPHFEVFVGQKVSKDIDVRIGPDLMKPENSEALKRVKDLLAGTGCTMHAVGVCGSDKAHFDFAAEFKIPLLNTEPNARDIEAISRRADEYKIRVGLHNHPYSSYYWSPDVVLNHLKDAGPLVGACCDTGHWLRSKMNPQANFTLSPLECIKKLKGKIVGFHIKDLKQREDGGLDVDAPLGQGTVGIAEILKEFATHKSDFKIPFSIEYEAAWDANQPKVAESVQFFDATAKEIVQAR